MALKRMSEFKRDDYSYSSPDGDQYEITIVQTADRKYVEIKKDGEQEEDHVQWDVEMLLDIADAVRAAVYKPAKSKPHQLRSPNVIDHREPLKNNPSPSDMIQASVDESMENIDSSVAPVQSFSSEKRDLVAELEDRKTMQRGVSDAEKMVKRA